MVEMMPKRTEIRLQSALVLLIAVCGFGPQSRVAWAASAPSWQYAVKKDNSGSLQAVYARLEGKGPSFLWLSCVRRGPEETKASSVHVAATVAQRQYLGPSDGEGRQTVYWLDDRSPEAAPWIYNDKYGQLVGNERVKTFVDRLVSARNLKVELSNYRLEPVAVDFRLDPVETRGITERFREDCGQLRRERS